MSCRCAILPFGGIVPKNICVARSLARPGEPSMCKDKNGGCPHFLGSQKVYQGDAPGEAINCALLGRGIEPASHCHGPTMALPEDGA